MNPVGPGNDARIVLPTAVRLTVGRILSVRVVERLAGDRVILEIDGKTLSARANMPLKPGDHVQVHVKGIDDSGRIILEHVREGESPLLRSMELPQDESHRAALEAFVRSGLPLDPSAIAATARRIRSEGADAAHIARLIAVLRGKGLPAHLVDEIISVTGGEARDNSDEHRGEERHGDRDRDRGSRGDTDRDRGSRGDTTRKSGTQRAGEPPLVEAGTVAAGTRRASGEADRRLAAAIKSLVQTPASTVRPIHLLNHFREGTAHWALIPLAVEPFEAVTLAVRFGETGAVDRATLRIRDGESRYQASWSPSGGPVSLTASDTEAAHTAAHMIAPLVEALAPLGLVPGEPRFEPRLDGFSDEPVEHILRTIDTEV